MTERCDGMNRGGYGCREWRGLAWWGGGPKCHRHRPDGASFLAVALSADGHIAAAARLCASWRRAADEAESLRRFRRGKAETVRVLAVSSGGGAL